MQNVKFQNFFYEFNSFIELNDFGGHISMIDTQFENIETCGSIIRNKKVRYEFTNSADFSTWSVSDHYQYRNNYLQHYLYSQVYDNVNNPYTDCVTTQTCFSIQIESSTFTNINYQRTGSEYPHQVNSTYKLKYRGHILDLDAFAGSVQVSSSTFSNSKAGYSKCTAAQYLNDNNLSGFTDKYSSFGTKSVFQIKSLISIVNHKKSVYLYSNTFT